MFLLTCVGKPKLDRLLDTERRDKLDQGHACRRMQRSRSHRTWWHKYQRLVDKTLKQMPLQYSIYPNHL